MSYEYEDEYSNEDSNILLIVAIIFIIVVIICIVIYFIFFRTTELDDGVKCETVWVDKITGIEDKTVPSNYSGTDKEKKCVNCKSGKSFSTKKCLSDNLNMCKDKPITSVGWLAKRANYCGVMPAWADSVVSGGWSNMGGTKYSLPAKNTFNSF